LDDVLVEPMMGKYIVYYQRKVIGSI